MAEGRPWPMRLPQMYVKVSFYTVKDYFQIFADDKVKISLYLYGVTNPKSVVISVRETDPLVPVCEPERVSDQITCTHVALYCVTPEHMVTLRIVAAGKILYHVVSCEELTSGAFDYRDTESLLL